MPIKKARKINLVGKVQKRHPRDHVLKDPFNLITGNIKGHLTVICPECESTSHCYMSRM